MGFKNIEKYLEDDLPELQELQIDILDIILEHMPENGVLRRSDVGNILRDARKYISLDRKTLTNEINGLLLLLSENGFAQPEAKLDPFIKRPRSTYTNISPADCDYFKEIQFLPDLIWNKYLKKDLGNDDLLLPFVFFLIGYAKVLIPHSSFLTILDPFFSKIDCKIARSKPS